MPAWLPDLHLLPFPPYRLSGVVVGALLNHPATLDALGDAVHRPPHKAPPQAPVLEVKPRHTLAGDGAMLILPAGVPGLVVGASLGLVVGRQACRITVEQAAACIAGCLVAVDVSLPLPGHYRPAVRLKARDGFCPLGEVVPLSALGGVNDLDHLVTAVAVAGEAPVAGHTGGRVRGAAQLLADVSQFMTLNPGDVLLLGPDPNAPRVPSGRSLSVGIQGLPPVHCQVVAGEHAA